MADHTIASCRGGPKDGQSVAYLSPVSLFTSELQPVADATLTDLLASDGFYTRERVGKHTALVWHNYHLVPGERPNVAA